QRTARAGRERASRTRDDRAGDPRHQRPSAPPLPLRPLQRQRRLDRDRLSRAQPALLERAAGAARATPPSRANPARPVARPARPAVITADRSPPPLSGAKRWIEAEAKSVIRGTERIGAGLRVGSRGSRGYRAVSHASSRIDLRRKTTASTQVGKKTSAER